MAGHSSSSGVDSTTVTINIMLALTYLTLAFAANAFFLRRLDRRRGKQQPSGKKYDGQVSEAPSSRSIRNNNSFGAIPRSGTSMADYGGKESGLSAGSRPASGFSFSESASPTGSTPKHATRGGGATNSLTAADLAKLENSSFLGSTQVPATGGSSRSNDGLEVKAFGTRQQGSRGSTRGSHHVKSRMNASIAEAQRQQAEMQNGTNAQMTAWTRDMTSWFFISIMWFAMMRSATMIASVLDNHRLDLNLGGKGAARNVQDQMMFPVSCMFYGILIVLIHRFFAPLCELRNIPAKRIDKFLIVAEVVLLVWMLLTMIINGAATHVEHRYLIIEYSSAICSAFFTLVYGILAFRLPWELRKFGDHLEEKAVRAQRVCAVVCFFGFLRTVIIIGQDLMTPLGAAVFIINWPTDFVPVAILLRMLAAQNQQQQQQQPQAAVV